MSAIQDVILALNNATNDVAATLTSLRLTLANGQPATPNELAQLDLLVARLETLAADPANPVPAA